MLWHQGMIAKLDFLVFLSDAGVEEPYAQLCSNLPAKTAVKPAFSRPPGLAGGGEFRGKDVKGIRDKSWRGGNRCRRDGAWERTRYGAPIGRSPAHSRTSRPEEDEGYHQQLKMY